MSYYMRPIRQRQAGETVPIVIRSRVQQDDVTDGELIDINGVDSPTVTGPTNNSVTPTGRFVNIGTGEIAYYWDTTGLAVGTYKLVFPIGINAAGEQITKTVYVQLL